MANLPNCDRCGRFTGHPVVETYCTGGNSPAHECRELLLCQSCMIRQLAGIARRNTRPMATHTPEDGTA